MVAVIAVGVVVYLMFGRRKSQAEGDSGSGAGSGASGKVASVDMSKGVSSDPNSVAQESINKSQQTQEQVNQTVQKGQDRQVGNQGERAERFRRLVGAFQQKGATSPEKALTAEELGLPPRFEEYMDSHSGQTKVFVEVNGKYYLDQKALEEMKQRMANRKP